MLVTTTVVMLLFKHKIIYKIKKMKIYKKKELKDESLYVSTSRLDTYISFDKSKRRRSKPIYVYLYMNILYCCFVVKYAGYTRK